MNEKINKISYNEYLNQFYIIAGYKKPEDLYKVDIPEDNKNNIYYKIVTSTGGVGVCCLSIDNINRFINIKGVIAYKSGYKLLSFIIKKYSKKYNLLLDTFKSNKTFYNGLNFKTYKVDPYKPEYDIYNLNIYKEPVYYMIYNQAAAVL